MRRLLTAVVAIIVGIGIVAGVTACSSASSKVDMSNVTAVIDVRTPAEFAAGHLQSAQLMDIQGSAFQSQIGKLDKNGTYVVYCKSGNRAGQAVTAMQAIGIKNVTNAGSLEQAAKATGLAIVK